jgi:hypothetical protein
VLPHLPLHRSCLVACCALAILWALILLFLFYFVSVQLLHFRRSSFIVAGRFFVLSLHSHPPRAGLFCVCICHCKPCVANARAEKKKRNVFVTNHFRGHIHMQLRSTHIAQIPARHKHTSTCTYVQYTHTCKYTHTHNAHVMHAHALTPSRASEHARVCVYERARTNTTHTQSHTITHLRTLKYKGFDNQDLRICHSNRQSP